MRMSLREHSLILSKEWSDRNTFSPESVSYGSNRKAWWRGKCGHEWEAIIKNRATGAGCPYCSGNKLLTGCNDLKTTNPNVAKEWSDRNDDKPSEVISMSNKIAWWKCGICQGEWGARVADRARGSGCPYCSFVKIQSGINDFATWYPKLAAELSERNGELLPQNISAKSRKNVWWKYSMCGFDWKRSIHLRIKGSGCPECHRKYMEAIRRDRRKIKQSFTAVLPQMTVFYYADTYGIPLVKMDESEIGIPFMAWFPERRGAIEVIRERGTNDDVTLRERVKTSLCMKAGIRLIRILSENEAEHSGCICIRRIDNEYDTISEAVNRAFGIIGYDINADVIRDLNKIQDYFIHFRSFGTEVAN